MTWIFVALLGPMLHALSSIIDNYFTGTVFKNAWVQIFYVTFFWILFLPFTFFFGMPSVPPLHLFPFLFLIGFIQVVYAYPYLMALRHEDTSVVNSLFSLGKIFIPVLAFFFLGEMLHGYQYLGFVLIISGSAFLSLVDRATFRLNKSFSYMLLCSLLLAIDSVIYKGLFSQMSWSTAFFWSNIFSFLVTFIILIFFSKIRHEVVAQRSLFKKHFWLLGWNEILVFSGTVATTLAISLAPALTLMKSIESLQPLFVLLYAIALRKFYPQLFHEKIDRHSTFKKVILFGVMIGGVALVLR